MLRSYEILEAEWRLGELHSELSNLEKNSKLTNKTSIVRPEGIHNLISYQGDKPDYEGNTNPLLTVCKQEPYWCVSWDLVSCSWRLNIIGEMIVHWIMLNNEYFNNRSTDKEYSEWIIREGKTSHSSDYSNLADAIIVAECLARIDWEPFKVY